MSLKLYNTRTRQLEEFRPLREGRVDIYVCGLTPSAEAHIGHARSFLFFDVLRRYLRHLGFDARYVQNVTDIDDRSIARARETGEDWYDIVSGYYASFKESMRRLDVEEPDVEPYATKFIVQIVEMIGELLEREIAYVSEDGVYYDVSKFPRYGALAHRKIDELEAGARIEVDEHKDDPLDFALWKFAKPGEPSWESPWGAGRPGWHIECSAMTRTVIGPDTFDMHGGGADLVFPHHENEIAQSEPLMPHPPMANFWVHGGVLLSDGKKMSKSLGNFEPLSELLDRHDPQAVRLLFLQTGYRKVMSMSEESLDAAAVSLERLKAAWRKLHPHGSAGALKRSVLLEQIEAALNNDMNTAGALAELHRFAANVDAIPEDSRSDAFREFSYALEMLGMPPRSSWLEVPKVELAADFLERLQRELSGEISFNGASPHDAIERIIAARNLARTQKDWSRSDRLRDALARCGVTLKDGKDGTTWTVDA